MADRLTPEFSRLLAVERLGERGFETRILANQAERRALALRFGLLALDRLEAELRASRTGPGELVRLTGHVSADVVQACVVSLEPVASTLDEDFAQLYDLNPAPGPVKEVTVAPGIEDDEPEPAGAEDLDLGEAVAQHLALMLDPYPRAPGAAAPVVLAPEGPKEAPDEGRRQRPFEALRALKHD